MSFTFDISTNIESLEEYLDDMKAKTVVQAAKGAISKTLTAARQESIKIVTKRYKTGSKGKGALTKSEVKAQMKLLRPRGKYLNSLVGTLYYGSKRYGLIKFVTGSKDKLKQKNIKLADRRKLKVQIIKGKTLTIKKGFIQKANTTQVFKGRAGDGFKRQAVASNAVVLSRAHNKSRLLRFVGRRFEANFSRELKFRLDKLAKRQRSAKMKKIQ